MKIHTPIFIIGLLVFITPAVGLPQIYEQIIMAVYGIAIMILVSASGKPFSLTNKKVGTNNIFHESAPEQNKDSGEIK